MVLSAVGCWGAAVVACVNDWIPMWSLFALAWIPPVVGWMVMRSKHQRRDQLDPLKAWRSYGVVQRVRLFAGSDQDVALELLLLRRRGDIADGVLLRFDGVRAFTMHAAGALGSDLGFLQCRTIWDFRAGHSRYRVQDRRGVGIAFLFDSLEDFACGQASSLTAQPGAAADPPQRARS